MRSISFILLIFFLLSDTVYFTEHSFADSRKTDNTAKNSEDDWVRMPAGSKHAFMGIHGGTMPVSLLVSTDGASLLGFVGQTGNDFLEVLRNAYLPLPSFGNSTSNRVKQLKNDGLFAGNATNSLPVFYLPDDPQTSRTLIGRLMPFGLSPKPLIIEGQLEKPELATREKKYRKFYLPESFQSSN